VFVGLEQYRLAQQTPLTAGPKQIENGVHYSADINLRGRPQKVSLNGGFRADVPIRKMSRCFTNRRREGYGFGGSVQDESVGAIPGIDDLSALVKSRGSAIPAADKSHKNEVFRALPSSHSAL
jgi:hypothetical protein